MTELSARGQAGLVGADQSGREVVDVGLPVRVDVAVQLPADSTRRRYPPKP